MIYTVTFNPSLDYVVKLPAFSAGTVNRTDSETLYAGGKGINVSLMLGRLGVESVAMGFLGGFTGRAIADFLVREGCQTDFIEIPDSMSRINVKLRADCESEINAQGPEIPDNALEQLFAKLDVLTIGDVLVLAGSIPKTLPADVYERIMARMHGKGISCAVDATGELLLRVLKYHPFLIKPNQAELEEICQCKARADDEIIGCAKELQAIGARNVLVSLAERGALLMTERGDIHRLDAPNGVLVNSVGAGDSMVAGFLAGFLRSGDYMTAFRMGVAAGSATAFSEWLGTGEQVERLMERRRERDRQREMRMGI